MYAWIWRQLPGGRLTRTAGALALAVAVIALLFLVVFPYAEPQLPWNHPTVSRP